MKNPTRPNTISEDAAYTEIQSVQPAADRIRFAALRLTGALSNARKKSLLRQEKAAVASQGPASTAAMGFRRRLELEERFAIAVRAEQQRGAVEPVQRNPEALILRGRVVDPRRLGLPKLTVSAINNQGQPTASAVSSETGYFEFLVPVKNPEAPETVSFLVNDSARNILYRGCEGFAVKAGAVVTRELLLSAADAVPQPTPPPDIDPKRVVVPDVQGLHQEKAAAQLKAARLAVGTVEFEPAEGDRAGTVLRQSPEAGSQAAPGSAVNLIVGKEIDRVTVPNLRGRTLKQAGTTLTKARLTVGLVDPAQAPEDSVVIRQKPVAGTQVDTGTAVALEVATESGRRTRPPAPKKVTATKRVSRKKTTVNISARPGDHGAST